MRLSPSHGIPRGKLRFPKEPELSWVWKIQMGKQALGYYAKGKPKRNVRAQVADQTEMSRDGEQMGNTHTCRGSAEWKATKEETGASRGPADKVGAALHVLFPGIPVFRMSDRLN